MRAYRIAAGGMIRFAGSMAEARQRRQDVSNETGISKMKIEIEEEEVPTNKAELIPFLNTLLHKATAT